MAPGKPAKVIAIKAPRHNAQRIGTKLGGEIKRISKEQKTKTEIYQPSQDIMQAVESASEWNSLLISARAERGPQWDVGTQQFLMDKYSDLYYDPTPLHEAVKKQIDEEKGESGEDAKESEPRPPPHSAIPPQMHHSSSRHHTPRGDRDFHPHHTMGAPMHDSPVRHHPPPPVNYPFPQTPSSMNMRGPPPGMSRPFPGHGGPPGGGAPFNPGPPNQFFGGEGGSPMRMNSMGGMGMMDHNMGGPMGRGGMPGGGMPPMGMGMGMGGGGGMAGPMSPMAGMGGGMGGGMMGGGMGGMPMNMGPDARGMGRGMGDDAFGMH